MRSRQGSYTRSSATESSTVPRLLARCPPVREMEAIKKARISAQSSGSLSTGTFSRSSWLFMFSSIDKVFYLL